MEPTEASQRPDQLPAVMRSQLGMTNLIVTPSRLATSVATSMSKPENVPSLFWTDCGA